MKFLLALLSMIGSFLSIPHHRAVVTGVAALVIALWSPELAGLGVVAFGALLTEGVRDWAFLLSEDNGKRSRNTVTVTVGAGVTAVAGLVLGKITATGKYVAYANGASNGSEVADAILGAELKNTTGGALDFTAVVIDADAEVRSAGLDWNGGDGTAVTAGTADLLAKGIRLRN